MKRSIHFAGLCLAFLVLFPQIALAKRPMPRVLVYLKGADQDTTQSTTEEVLQEMGLKIYDRDQLRNIKEVDAALSTNDKKKLKSLKNRYGIEVIVAGKAKKTNKQYRRIYGRRYTYFKPYVTMKAIVTDTAEIIYSKALRGHETARSAALDKLAKKLARIMGKKIKAHWAKAAFQQASFELVVSKLPYGQLASLEKYIKSLPRVLASARRNYSKSTAKMDVTYRGSRTQLEKALVKCTNPSLKVVRTTANRIDLVVGKTVVAKDTKAPQIQITSPKKGAYINKSKVLVAGYAFDKSGILKVYVNGVRATLKKKIFYAYVKTKAGKNTLIATAWDKAGNKAFTSVVFFVDSTPPYLKITYPVKGKTYNKKTIIVRGRVMDPLLQSVTVQGVLARIKKGRFWAKVTFKKDGKVTLIARARDTVGNASVDMVAVRIDSQPPRVTFRVMITGSVDKPGSRVWVNGKEVSVVRGRWQAYVDISRVKQIIIEAIDPAGNRTIKMRTLGK